MNFQHGSCPWGNGLKKCRLKHELATPEPKPAEDPKDAKVIEVEAGMIQCNVADSFGNKPFLVDKVLIDGGSNEIIRPNYPDIWRQIMAGHRGTKKVDTDKTTLRVIRRLGVGKGMFLFAVAPRRIGRFLERPCPAAAHWMRAGS